MGRNAEPYPVGVPKWLNIAENVNTLIPKRAGLNAVRGLGYTLVDLHNNIQKKKLGQTVSQIKMGIALFTKNTRMFLGIIIID